MNDAATTAKRSWPQMIGQPFITGVLSFLPLALTLAILGWVVVFLHDLVGPGTPFGTMLQTIGLSVVQCDFIAWVIGLAVTLVVIYVIGWYVERGKTRKFQAAMEAALQRVPLVSTVYDASKQLTSMFDRKNDDVKGMTPVVCTLGKTAILALMPTSEPIYFEGRAYHVVIIPTAPVPFGGAMLCVPVEQVHVADCNFDGLVSMYMSMGMSAPDYFGKPSLQPEFRSDSTATQRKEDD